MSTLQKSQGLWSSVTGKPLESKYEKCRNITEEIYKRINITFEIKKLEGTHSDLSDPSDQIDSNELSNETDLFACDKTSLSSSTDAEKPQVTCEKYININNNEETKKNPIAVYKRPKKRFRKRVKKRQSKSNQSDTDGSSDEAPLSRIIEADAKCVKASQVDSPHNVMGVPNIVIIANLKPKHHTPERKSTKKEYKVKTALRYPESKTNQETTDSKSTRDDKVKDLPVVKDEKTANLEWKNCGLCSMSFRGDRGLRRHMAISHILNPEDTKKAKSIQRDKSA